MHYIELLVAKLHLFLHLLNNRIDLLHLLLSECTHSLYLIDLQSDTIDLCLYVSCGFLLFNDLNEIIMAPFNFFKFITQLLNRQFHIWLILFFDSMDLKGVFGMFLL
jgi:hypothetical protein